MTATRQAAPAPGATRGPKVSRRAGRAAPVALLLLTGAITVVGLVMVLSSSSVQALRIHGSSWHFFNRQLLWVGLGGVAMALAAGVDYRRWRPVAPFVIAVSVALMILVLIPGVGIRVSGSSRWLGAGPFRMQPAELAKLGVVLFAADLLARRAGRVRDWRQTLRPVVGLYLGLAFLLIAQPDLGTALVTGCIVVALLFLAGAPLGWMAGLVTSAAAATLLLAKIEPYRWARITSFLNPFADATNTGYQAAQARVALASGGLSGMGLGQSRAKWGFLPAAHTDFIFAIVGEELGLIGALVVLALFGGLAFLGVRTALRAPDRFGVLLAGGITAWLVSQAVINIGAVVGLLPITGVPLPLVSSGGSSLVPMMAGLGMVFNIARQRRPTRAAPTEPS